MYMAFDAVLGTRCIRGVRGDAVEASDVIEGLPLGVCACDTTLLTPSGTGLFIGGGNGDIEMLEVEAVWAWYTRRGWKDGRDKTCCNP